MNEQNKIILYQDDNEITRVSVRFADEDLWLTQFEIYRKREMDLLESDFDRGIKKLKEK